MKRQRGFWDVEHRLEELSRQGDALETLSVTVDLAIFRPALEEALGRRDAAKGGRPPLDAVLGFRMLVLQALPGLSLEQTEYSVRERLSWMRFRGLGPGDAVADANTPWDFREAPMAGGALDAPFARLEQAITEAGHLPPRRGRRIPTPAGRSSSRKPSQRPTARPSSTGSIEPNNTASAARPEALPSQTSALPSSASRLSGGIHLLR